MQVEKDWRAFGHKFYTRCQQAGSVRQTVLSHVHMPTNSRLILHAASNQFCFAHHTQTATRALHRDACRTSIAASRLPYSYSGSTWFTRSCGSFLNVILLFCHNSGSVNSSDMSFMINSEVSCGVRLWRWQQLWVVVTLFHFVA